MDHFEYIHQNQVFSIDPNLRKTKAFFIISTLKKKKGKIFFDILMHSLHMHHAHQKRKTQISHCFAGINLNKLRK
jgi:hypothetical protein